jgi:dienelactone hydrolase
MVLKHGSGGITGANGDNFRKWAQTLTQWGVAAFLVDSFGPRGISDTATNQSQLSPWADVADSFAALKVLGADPRIDRKRIGIIGWSRGAGAALLTAFETARKSMIADDLKFAAHVIFYAPASVQYRDSATDRSPILALHGEADDYTPIAPLRDYINWVQSMGNSVTLVSYPSTYHDFDVEGGYSGLFKGAEICLCDVVYDLTTGRVARLDHQDNPTATLDQALAYTKSHMSKGAHLAPNAAARADAVEKVHAFLKQNLGVVK